MNVTTNKTIKSYTDIEQSKRLAKILPLESADMFWLVVGNTSRAHVLTEPLSNYSKCESYPCWSLAALLDVLPFVDFTMPQLIGTPKTLYRCIYNDDLKSHVYGNAVDACYEMILKLKEKNLL